MNLFKSSNLRDLNNKKEKTMQSQPMQLIIAVDNMFAARSDKHSFALISAQNPAWTYEQENTL